MAEAVRGEFKKKTIAKLLQQQFADEKTKTSAASMELCAELMRVFCLEALLRSEARARSESASEVTVEHFEKCLPQLLLDF